MSNNSVTMVTGELVHSAFYCGVNAASAREGRWLTGDAGWVSVFFRELGGFLAKFLLIDDRAESEARKLSEKTFKYTV